MLGIMLQKMWHKKWMNLSLLLGCILLVATVVSFPLYQKAAYDRMLQDEFRNYITSQGKYPTTISMKSVSQRDKTGKTKSKIEEKMSTIAADLGTTSKLNLQYLSLTKSSADSDLKREDGKNIDVYLGGITGLEDHVELLSGELFSESGLTEDGKIEVIVSQGCMVRSGILIGESLTFQSLKDPEGNPITIVIKGVFMPDDDTDYWQISINDLGSAFLMNMDLFNSMFTGDNLGKYNISCSYYTLLDYKSIEHEQVSKLVEDTKYLVDKSKFRSVVKEPEYLELLDSYLQKINRISATLLILQIPVLIMLAAFLFMISGQMYEMEKNEISVIKSRGSSRGQIFRLYLYQGIVLTLIGGLLGVPLGALFSKVLGSVQNFLEFDTSRSLTITYTKTSAVYAAVAMLVTLLSITIPAISHSKVSIVKLKQSKNVRKKSWWKKLYLDFVLLGVAGYGYYTFYKNMTAVSGTVMEGQSLDPLLYISSSLFIVGMGLLFLRLQPHIVKLIYWLGSRFWGPASYISFMETIKQGSKQQLIILFLIMTVSLGMYHSTVARTILDNAVRNTDYIDACDMILEEYWTEIVDENGALTGAYVEPDYKKFASMDFAQQYTRVYMDEYGYISEEKSSRQAVTIMGIHTKEFGELTFVDESVLGKHYYEYLNELAVEQEGVLVSSNFKTKLGYEVGDTLAFYNSAKTGASCKIVDFIDYWPGYAPTKLTLSPDGSSEIADNYLVVTHYDLTRQKFGVRPYEIWVSLNEDADEEAIYNWIEGNEIKVKRYVNRSNDLLETMSDPLLQGTNGILTLGFVVTLVLCAVGYMIYWIMSIKDRELIFGVLRAGGFHKNEIVRMLLVEQLFAGVFAVFAGIGIGWISSVMFVPIIQLSYASATQVLPLTLIMDQVDFLRLFGVIAGVMLTCLIVLISLLFHMNVTKALKLGEE